MRKREGEKIHVKVLFCHTKTRQVNPFFANIFQRTLSVKYILVFLFVFFQRYLNPGLLISSPCQTNSLGQADV